MATLIVIDGPAQGQKFALAQHRVVMIGRDAEATFQVLDDHVSRSHLQIKRIGDTDSHAAADFASANGVMVNDRRIPGETALSDGDVIRIGNSSIMYTTMNDPDAQTISQLLRRFGEGRRETILDRAPARPD